MPTTIGVTIIGATSTSRATRVNGSSAATSSASPRPRTVSIVTASATNLIVTQSAWPNAGSWKSWR